jgi:hypothetical protein
MNCHLEHDIEEVFIKRNFRCDCGTQTSSGSCMLDNTDQQGMRSEHVNSENRYSHNFDGSYCHCSAPYDPDADTMFQCALCEDWFHSACLMPPQSPETDEAIFICRQCSPSLAGKFLVCYSQQSVGAAESIPELQGKKRARADITADPLESACPAKLPRPSSPSATDRYDKVADGAVGSRPPLLNARHDFNAPTHANLDSGVDAKETAKSGGKTEELCRRPVASSCGPASPHEAPRDYFLLADSGVAGLCHCPACEEHYRSLSLSFLFEAPSQLCQVRGSRTRKKANSFDN